MFCTKCGTENPDQARACICCGHTWPAPVAGTVLAQPRGQAPNDSGQPAIRDVPAGVPGISLAGFVPFGLFALYNGMFGWGMAGLLLNVMCWPAYLVYVGYITVNGRKDAWRMRRFGNGEDFERTMLAWNIAGAVSCLLGAAALIVVAELWSSVWTSLWYGLPASAPSTSGG